MTRPPHQEIRQKQMVQRATYATSTHSTTDKCVNTDHLPHLKSERCRGEGS